MVETQPVHRACLAKGWLNGLTALLLNAKLVATAGVSVRRAGTREHDGVRHARYSQDGRAVHTGTDGRRWGSDI